MKVRVLGAAGGEAPGHRLTGFLIDDEILLDAGTISSELDLHQQRKIKHVLITHAHLDHVHALPFLLDNLIGRVETPVNVYGHPDVLEAVHQHIFNGRIWPDFSLLPTAENPVMQFCPLQAGQQLSLNGYIIEPVVVKHSFAAYAYIISDGKASIVFSGDTAAGVDLWERIGKIAKVNAAFIECSFSTQRQDMATMTSHLTPADIVRELNKTGRAAEIPVYLYHVKPDFFPDITKELSNDHLLRMVIAREGEEYSFT